MLLRLSKLVYLQILIFYFFSKGLFDESGKTRDTRNIIIKNSVRVHEVRMNSFTTLFYYNVKCMYLHFIFSKFHFQFENSSTTLPRLSFKSSTANPETFKTKIIDQTKNTTSNIRLSKSDHSMVTSDMFHGLQGEVKTVRNQLSYGIYIYSMIRSFFLICRVEPIQWSLIQACYFSCLSNMFSILFLFQMLNNLSLNLFCYNSFNKQLTLPIFFPFQILRKTTTNGGWRLRISKMKQHF